MKDVVSERILLHFPENTNLGANIDSKPPFQQAKAAAVYGGVNSCFYISISTDGSNFTVLLDTGSSDTVLPHAVLNNYEGLCYLNDSIPSGGSQLGQLYGDGSWWNGFLMTKTIKITGTNIIANNVPIIEMTLQSTDPAFLFGRANGLMGLAYGILSKATSSPKTAMEAFAASGKIMKNEIGIQGCQASLIENSWIDFGNTDGYNKCGFTGPVAYTISPVQSYHTVNIVNIFISSVKVELPASFQTTAGGLYGFGTKAW